jgi:hypothetical protein
MKNEGDIEFTASPTLPQGVDFTPETGGTMGASGSTGGTQNSQSTQGGDAMEQARRLVSTAQERATEQVQARFDATKTRAAESLSGMAQTLRDTTQHFAGQQDGIGRYISQAADRVDHIATYLQDRELNEIVGEVEDFARRQPVAFLGGAFALGVLGARFLKSSSGHAGHHHVHERMSGSQLHDHVGDLTSRVREPQDAIGRPLAPGYSPPSDRGMS